MANDITYKHANQCEILHNSEYKVLKLIFYTFVG
jgi:hypothetical protein